MVLSFSAPVLLHVMSMPRTAASVLRQSDAPARSRVRRRRRVSAPTMASSLSSALDRLATVAQSCELTYRAGERHMRDRGTAAQIWACAEQAHELYRGVCERLILMGAA